MILTISLADGECALVGEHPGLNKIAGFTKVESVTKFPEDTVSEGHFAGCERFICGPPAIHVPAPVGYFRCVSIGHFPRLTSIFFIRTVSVFAVTVT